MQKNIENKSMQGEKKETKELFSFPFKRENGTVYFIEAETQEEATEIANKK